MIFAPVIRRTAYANAPRSTDLALQRFLMGALDTPARARTAGCTVTRDDKATTLQLDVPGLAREQLQISIEGKVVRLHSVEGAPARCSAPGNWPKTLMPLPARPSWKTACSR